MFALANVALAITLVLVMTVGIRLLLAARRTRRVPELCIGLALVLSAIGGAAEGASLRIAGYASAESLTALHGGALLLHAGAAAVLYVAVWRIFHPGRSWARTLALLGSAATFAGWLASLSYVPGSGSEVEAGWLLLHAGRIGAYAWGAWESLHYHGLMQRRLRLGLADAGIANQFRLWGIASSCMVGVLLLALVSEQTQGLWVFDWAPGLAGMAVLGLGAAVALYGAFFPPESYRRWVAGRHSRSSPLDRLIPQRIREGPPDAFHSARILLVAGASALLWGPAFVFLAATHGAPEMGVVVAVHVAIIAAQPLLLRLTGSLVLSANLMLVSLFGLTLLGGAASGGLGSPSVVWLMVLPIGGFFLSGARSGAVWTAVSFAAVVGFHLAGLRGDLAVLPKEQLAILPAMRAINLLAVLSVITAVGWRFIREKERTVSEMTAARDEAREADAAKMRFLAAMSHEIRTPMNGALGMTELLIGTELTEEQRRFAETIRRCGHTLLAVIDDVLDFSRIEAGNLRLERLDFDPRVLLEDLLEIVAEPATAKGLELHCSVSRETPAMLRGDPERLRQILLNLVGNAVKFTQRGEVELAVSALAPALADGRVYVRFEVRDTGIGFSPEAAARIFERFTQADESMSRRYGGSGLGLAIARELARLMDGDIDFESRPGAGSEFRLTIPLTPVEKHESAAAPLPKELRGHNVLIVDDNVTNREILSRQLTWWGLRCRGAADGRQALDALRGAEAVRSPFTLALLDVHMPGMDGVELVHAIRAEASLSGVRLLMLTSIGPAGQEEELRALDVDGILRKPVRESQLRRCIEDALRGQPLPAERADAVASAQMSDAPARILLVEDNPINQSVAIRMLEMLGHELELAGDGHEALEALERESFDLVLMDCQMPELDGFEATRLLRARETARGRARSLPVIALTASAMQGDRERCLEAGMDDYLAKPFSSAQLAQALQRWLPERAPSSVEPDTPTVLKRSALDEIRALEKEGEPGLLEEIIDSYLDTTPDLIDALRDAVASDDPESLHAAAHKLKSSSALLGAMDLAEACRRLERIGRAGSTSGALDLLGALESEFRAVCLALDAEREGSGS